MPTFIEVPDADTFIVTLPKSIYQRIYGVLHDGSLVQLHPAPEETPPSDVQAFRTGMKVGIEDFHSVITDKAAQREVNSYGPNIVTITWDDLDEARTGLLARAEKMV